MNPYEVLVRSEVEDDLRQRGQGDQQRLIHLIRQRLGVAPNPYGKPLGGTLKGLRRIRIGDFRVTYQVEGQQVILWAIKHRKEIYHHLEQRLSKRTD